MYGQSTCATYNNPYALGVLCRLFSAGFQRPVQRRGDAGENRNPLPFLLTRKKLRIEKQHERSAFRGVEFREELLSLHDNREYIIKRT